MQSPLINAFAIFYGPDIRQSKRRPTALFVAAQHFSETSLAEPNIKTENKHSFAVISLRTR